MSSQKHGPGQGAYRKGSGSGGSNRNMNPPPYLPYGHPDNRFSNTAYSNDTTTPRVVPPPPSALLQTPNMSLPANNNNLGQYQITVSLNAPGPQGASYPPQGPPYPAPNIPPYQPLVAPSHLAPKGPAYDYNQSSQNNMFPPDKGFHAEAPPPYTPYTSEPPPPSYFKQASSSDKNNKLEHEKEFKGQGKGSRMKGHYSQSCSNLNNNFASDAPDLSHYKGQGHGRERNKGQVKKQGYSRNDVHSMDEDSDCDSRKSWDQGGSSYQRGRGRGNKRGFHRGRGRGGYKDRKDKGHLEHDDDDDCSSDDSKQSSGRRYDHDTAFKQRGKERINKSGVHRGRGGDYHRGKMGGRSSGDRERHNSDITPSDATGAKPKVFTGATAQELCVSLHFKTCFENAKALKKEIDSTLKNTADFEVSYEEILLRHADNEAFCKLTISGNSISLAKKNVKQMVFVLRKKLDAFIEYKFGNDDNAKSEEMHQDKKEKRRDTAAAQVSDSENKQDQRQTKTASEQSGGKQNSNTPSPVPAVLSFSIEKCFSSPKAFKNYLLDMMLSLPFEVKIDDISISLSAEISKCIIHTKSKADSKKLKQFFSNVQKQTEHTMTYSTENHEQPKNSAMLEQKEKALSSMKKKKFVVLKAHEEKLTQFVKELMKDGSAKSSSETGNDLEAMQAKVTEAMKQKEEFSTYCDTLYKRLESMDPSTLAEKDISRINGLFDTECNRLNRGLPVYAYRDDIIKCVKSNQVSIIVGRSGCGKSTQIVQYLFDSGYGTEGTIVCTQPEGLAAVTLAEKVAKEMNVKVGTSVGFKTSMYTKANRNTKIQFMTDRSLLEENENFDKYSCIIVDETHEHSVYTDLLLGMIKSCLPMRQDLKLIIISSSPVDTKLFMKYFKKAPELKVHGRNFRVEEFYTNDKSEDFDNYEEKAVSKACEIHTNEEQGDILVFLSLPAETLRCCREFEQRFKGEKNFKCMPLHNNLPPDELQKTLFKELPEGQRKIIFTTKYAETCISIDDIRYVIDTGMTSEVKYDSAVKVNLTTTSIISQHNAELRKQCAGLFAGGKCYRLYSEESFHILSQSQAPEILRVHLEKALLKLLDLGVNLQAYEFVQPPSEMALEVAIDTLKHYGAIADHQITDAGKWISKLPFDPNLSFLIYGAEQNELLYDAVVLAAIISLGSDFSYRSFDDTSADVESRNKKFFGSAKMDAFDWLQVYKHCNEMLKEQKSHWCREKSVNYKMINSVRYSVEEVKSILSKKFNIQMKLEFSCKTNAMSSLKKFYLKSKHPQFSTL